MAIFSVVFFPSKSGRVVSFCINVSVGIRNRKAHSPTEVAGISFPRTWFATIDLIMVNFSSLDRTRRLVRTYMDTVGSNNDIFLDYGAIGQSQCTSLAIYINHLSRQIQSSRRKSGRRRECKHLQFIMKIDSMNEKPGCTVLMFEICVVTVVGFFEI